ncbi:unnamed protein product [Ixodes hexagonus]
MLVAESRAATVPPTTSTWASIFWRRIHRHWYYLSWARSHRRQVRLDAVRALADLRHLTDAQFCEIAQACDIRTSVGLARTPSADMRLFLPPPRVPGQLSQGSLAERLRQLLVQLPATDRRSCISFFTHHALQAGRPRSHVVRSPAPRPQGEEPWHDAAETELDLALQALVRHSGLAQHRAELVRAGLLPLLQRLLVEHPDAVRLHSLAAQALANLSLEPDLHHVLFRSGWVGILARWLRSPDTLLSFPASRALANMDADSPWPVGYNDGVYLLYPEYRASPLEPLADVVLVHGLLGSVFKTWRQHDSQAGNGNDAEEPHVVAVRGGIRRTAASCTRARDRCSGYTTSWPKSWLAEDLPRVRILALDYDTYLSQWGLNCPLEPDKRTLESRAAEMLTKLRQAGVGARPVVWISHSMGGLLVKQMLCQAMDKHEAVARQTVGVVFYAVPHRGASLTDLNASFQLLLLPSVELQELRKDSPKLLEMHRKFVHLVNRLKIPCLSFGECVQTVLGLRMGKVLVPRESADPGLGDFFLVNTSHLEICKFQQWSSVSYQLLLDFIECSLAHLQGTDNQVNPAQVHESDVEHCLLGLC